MALNSPITSPERFTAIINNDSGNMVMTLRMAEFIEVVVAQINQNAMTKGIGSPEGILAAQPLKIYLDTGAVSGSNLYVKKTGAGDTGWVLV